MVCLFAAGRWDSRIIVMSALLASFPVASPAALDALVGAHVTGETPEVYWEDRHGLFRFESEAEARAAMTDRYYQLFLPQVKWDETVIREVHSYRRYTRDSQAIWAVVDATAATQGSLQMSVRHGLWTCAFGDHPAATSRFPAVSICLAALHAHQLRIEPDIERIEAELNRAGAGVAGVVGAEELLEMDREPRAGWSN